MPINTAPSVTEKDIKTLVKSLNALAERINQMPTEGGKTFGNTAPTRKPIDPNKRAREAEKIMRNAIKPTIGPFAKIMGRFVESAFGRAMIHWVGTTKSYFSNFASQASSLMNKAFGQFLDDLQPIIQTLKTSVNFLYDVVLKPIAKLFSGIAKWGWNKITDAFGSIKDKFSIKKKPEEIVAKAVVRQVDYLKRIDLNTRRIERNTRKEGSAYRRAHLGALLMRMGSKTSTAPTNDELVSGAGGSAKGILGGAFGFAKTVATGVISFIGGIFKTAGNIASLVPIIGPLLGPLVTYGLPMLLAGGLLKGIWNKFMDDHPEIKTWIDDNVKKPIRDLWDNTIKPELKKTAKELAVIIGNGILDIVTPSFLKKGTGTPAEEKQKSALDKVIDAFKNRKTNKFGTGFWSVIDLLKSIDDVNVERAKNLFDKHGYFTNPKEKMLGSGIGLGGLNDSAKSFFDWFAKNGRENLKTQKEFYKALNESTEASKKEWNPSWGTNNAYASPTPLNPLTKNTAPSLPNSVTIPIPIEQRAVPSNLAGLTPYAGGKIDIDKLLDKVSQIELSGKKNWNQLHFPGTKNTAMGPLGLTTDWWSDYAKRTPGADINPAARGVESQVRAVWKTAVEHYAKRLSDNDLDVSEINLWMCHHLGVETAVKYLKKGRNTMMSEVWKNNESIINAHKAKGLTLGQYMDKVSKRAFASSSKAIGGVTKDVSISETVGNWFQDLSRKIGAAVDLTPEEMDTLFNPAPRSSVEAAERERKQNEIYRKMGEYTPDKMPGNTTLVNNNVASSNADSGYSTAPRIFDSVFPQFEWVLANH